MTISLVRVVPLLAATYALGQQPPSRLPLPSGTVTTCVQQAGNPFSHNDTYTRYDLDWDTPNNSDEVVLAPVAGVAYTLPDGGARSFGNHINIDLGAVNPAQPNGPHRFWVIAHLKTFLIRSGTTVQQGQPVGMEGCTGFCQGDHVHSGLHEGNPQADALQSTSVPAQIVARDVTSNGQFTTLGSSDIRQYYRYESNNAYPNTCAATSVWTFAQDSQCWHLGSNGGATTMGFSAPDAWILATYQDPQIISPPLHIDTSAVAGIEVRLASLAGNREAQVFFATDTSPNFSSDKSSDFVLTQNDGSYQTYRFALNNNPNWRGRITRLRFDPVVGAAGQAIGIQWIRLVQAGQTSTSGGSSGLPFFDDVEGGNRGWTSAGSGLWHVSNRRSSSGRASWYYGRESSGNYDLPGQAHSGTLESPAFTISSNASLGFRSWHETEDEGTSWDKKAVDISINGGVWQPLDMITSPSRTWILKTIDLSPFRGSVRIRFRFETVDSVANQFEGWYVDDISIGAGQATTTSSSNRANVILTLNPNPSDRVAITTCQSGFGYLFTATLRETNGIAITLNRLDIDQMQDFPLTQLGFPGSLAGKQEANMSLRWCDRGSGTSNWTVFGHDASGTAFTAAATIQFR